MASINDTGTDQLSPAPDSRDAAFLDCYRGLRQLGISPLRAVGRLRLVGLTLDEGEKLITYEMKSTTPTTQTQKGKGLSSAATQVSARRKSR